jgi:hypothetical protein
LPRSLFARHKHGNITRRSTARLSRAGLPSSRIEAPTQVFERGPSALAAVTVLGREPFFAFGEKPAYLSEEHACRRIGATKLLDALEALDHSPGLIHESRLERDYARVCDESSRGRRQSRQYRTRTTAAPASPIAMIAQSRGLKAARRTPNKAAMRSAMQRRRRSLSASVIPSPRPAPSW